MSGSMKYYFMRTSALPAKAGALPSSEAEALISELNADPVFKMEDGNWIFGSQSGGKIEKYISRNPGVIVQTDETYYLEQALKEPKLAAAFRSKSARLYEIS